MDKRNSHRDKGNQAVINKARKIDHRNIVLIGYRCSGKTAVGRHLAKALGRQLVDTDARIEQREKRTISTLVLRHGWGRFRTLEARVIRGVSRARNLIIATGGGAVLDDANVKHLRTNGLIVWLQADAAELRSRLAKDPRSPQGRPALTGTNALDEIADVLRARTPYYEKASDLAVNTTHFNINEVAGYILGGMERVSGDRSR